MQRQIRAAAAIAAIAMVGVTGCKSDGWLTPPPKGTPITITRLPDSAEFMTFSGMTTARRLIIRNDTEWQAAWVELTRGRTPVTPAPIVDFTNEMLVLAALGTKPTGGYSIIVDEAYATAGSIFVSVRSVSPGASCVTTQALTQPVDVVRMPRDDRPVEFVESSMVRNCP